VFSFFKVYKWSVIFVYGYGCEIKLVLKKEQLSLYLNMFGDER
jgi:hypothetical protein